VVTGGTGNDGLTGLKLHVRRWFRSDLSLEAQVGLLWSNEYGGAISSAVGGTAALRLDIRDQGSFYLRWDMLPTTSQSTGGFFDPGGTQQALSLGIGTGSVPALITTGTAGITLAAVLIALFVADN